jgi:YfiH family protein
MTLDIIRSPLLAGVRHGFFTRRGGASSGVYHGLNCGPGSDDQGDAVRINRARVAEAMGVTPERLLSLHQRHSAVVAVAGPEGWAERPMADAVVTDRAGVAVSVLTADCAPVLLADPEAGVVGAAHAGWKGAVDGVIEATLTAMEGLGARTARIRAAVGPTISQLNYEVGPEFLDRFAAEDETHTRYFINGTGDRYRFDLPGFVLGRLRAAGVADAHWVGACTYADPDRFFSYRRATHVGEADYGRLISVIAAG